LEEFLSIMPVIAPEKILRDLRELWADLSRDQESSSAVLRACAMTLIVLAEDEADAEHARQILGVLMHDQPSRAIVLRAVEGADLDARVFAECWKPFGSRQQICSEGIEVTADAANLGDVASLLLPLIVPDLPVVLWARGPRFFTSRFFDPLFPLAGKIIVNSLTAPNAKGALAVLKELHCRGRRVADLAWTRLTGWREALAHEFEQAWLAESVNIVHGGPPDTSVLYFCRWMERSLPAARVTLESQPGSPGLRSVTVHGDRSVVVRLLDGTCLEVETGERASRSLLPTSTDDALMREELSILGPDPSFELVLS
jgi:glucose-6-phosphate dehydrogenase assembly protein OpcA